MIIIPKKEKTKIILELLIQRYQAENQMRQRSTDIAKWILGLGIGLFWIILSLDNMILLQRIYLSIFVTVMTCGVIYFIGDIRKGFNKNRNVIVKLESLLGFFKQGEYIEDDVILPSDYKEIRKEVITSHFWTLYILLILVCIFLLMVIITRPA